MYVCMYVIRGDVFSWLGSCPFFPDQNHVWLMKHFVGPTLKNTFLEYLCLRGLFSFGVIPTVSAKYQNAQRQKGLLLSFNFCTWNIKRYLLMQTYLFNIYDSLEYSILSTSFTLYIYMYMYMYTLYGIYVYTL